MNYNEIINAGADGIAYACGVRSTNQHPFAEELARSPLSKLAHACGLRKRPDLQDKPMSHLIALGMGTSDFSKALADGTKQLAFRRFDTQAQHRTFCSEIELTDFRPVESVDIDTSLDLGKPLSDLGEFTFGTANDYHGNNIALRTYGKILPFSRQMVVNDNIGAIKSIVANGGAAAARTEARLVAEALESNNPMADGGLPFHATYVNIQAAPLDHSTLGQAVAKLRLQATPEGNRADFSAAHLVVAADIEYAARKLVHESGASIAVSSLANLPDGRWYLLASPEVAQTITVGTLKGSARPITVEQRAVSAFENDSTAIRIRADLAAALQSRVGIIRGGV